MSSTLDAAFHPFALSVVKQKRGGGGGGLGEGRAEGTTVQEKEKGV